MTTITSPLSVILKLVVEIDGREYAIKTVDYTESIGGMIGDGILTNTDTAIVEHLTEEFYENDSGI